ncbi:MFS transporter [Salinibacterium sp. ZJ454]|uniref:MFS transporter n=1 Tax=Salinibacterium sp. ZJ454 TaxID=2708339 RepID=UPI00141ECB09|nr:MFS transporter [Salinibacterium sp. ZJ454]
MTTDPAPFRWRGVLLSAILPTLVFSIGEGAILPLIPIVANNLGAGLAGAGLIASLITVGALAGAIPGGWIVSRIGERAAMITAALLSAVGVSLAALAPNSVVLGIGILLIGISAAVFGLARHAFMTTYVPLQFRARALSTLGGTFRLGFFIGPFISAAVIAIVGDSQPVFWLHLIASVTAALMLIFLPDPESTFRERRVVHEGEIEAAAESHGVFHTIWAKRGVLLKLGSGSAMIAGLRASRQVILPLWAVSIGISEANTALIIGIAGGVDFALFYTGGQIMDRFGRLWTAVPSMIGLGIGHLVLAFTHDLSANVTWFIAAAMLLSLANGIGSGIIMTLGADLADKDNPAPFLGAWRFTTEGGGAAAPLLLSAITAVASLSVAAGAMGVLGLLGAGILARYIPKYIPRRKD